MSVSSAFRIPSEALGPAHVPSVQMVVAQSRATLHAFPTSHVFGQVPPQSTSVSAPFFTPSVQVVAGIGGGDASGSPPPLAGAHAPLVQVPVAQSEGAEHAAPMGAPPSGFAAPLGGSRIVPPQA